VVGSAADQGVHFVREEVSGVEAHAGEAAREFEAQAPYSRVRKARARWRAAGGAG
jgi:hypothetical protein